MSDFRAPCRMNIEFSFKCCICGAVSEEFITTDYGMEILPPTVPINWRRLDGGALCPKHDVVTIVDGRLLTWEREEGRWVAKLHGIPEGVI